MAALFSCTKCHKRYPFDELSQGEQLCKDCRNNYPVVKCTYCRAEFQQNSKGSTSSICAKCAQNVKHYGKPTACENCSVLAAFIGNRCQRCVNSEKKWGPPLVCEQCKLKCAFDRPERRKVDGKLMCWLCDQAYKRVLAKTRKSQDLVLKPSKSSSSLLDSSSKSNTPTNNGQAFLANQGLSSSASFEGMTVLERLTRLATSGGSSRGNTPPVEAKQEGGENRLAEKATNFQERSSSVEDEEVKEDKEKLRSHNRHHHRKHHHHHHRSHSKRRHSKEEDESGDVKKQKSEKNSANGVAATAAVSTPKSTGSNISETGVDTAASENVILITQLREQIESLKKLMAGKDQQLLEKDKKITELKAQMYENDKEFRSKVQALQRGHATAIETLQIKNREMTRQIASLTKNKKTVEPSSLNLGAS
ncbi:protein FAM76A-like [Physella acuta]|uniref:protein FAM76A-like n=1 Tax=Physella acuta TaxID=109671 RepID=UPI0027DC72CD|nr:protein FAM76A-like [Physella acuta]